jgi:hypothetical protein
MPNESDQYRKKARLLPVRLLVLPVVLGAGVLVITLTGNLNVFERLGVGALTGLLSSFGLNSLLEQFGRDQGKKKEPQLWASWGGSPTTQMLRHRDRTMSNRTMRQRYHEKLASLLSNVHIPTSKEEANDPAGADNVYEACTRYLINQTRDTEKFSLIFEENINYGFRRNLWGMRPAGIMLAVIGIIVALCTTYLAWIKTDPLWIVGAGATIVNTCFLVWWILRITPSWVFVPAKAYAERLLEACDSLTPNAGRGTRMPTNSNSDSKA